MAESKLPKFVTFISFEDWNKYTNATGHPRPDRIDIVCVKDQTEYDTLLDAITNQEFETVVPYLLGADRDCKRDEQLLSREGRIKTATELIRAFFGEDDYTPDDVKITAKVGIPLKSVRRRNDA